jgi:hypothetical protein
VTLRLLRAVRGGASAWRTTPPPVDRSGRAQAHEALSLSDLHRVQLEHNFHIRSTDTICAEPSSPPGALFGATDVPVGAGA